MKRISYFLFTVLAFGSLMTGCKKSDSFPIAPEVATFTNMTTATYEITGPTVTYKVPIGVTTVSAEARTVTVTITSPTGAVENQHYTVDTKTVTIPAGQAVDSITVQGDYASYLAGRKDTLVFTIVEPGVAPSDFNSTFTLLMRGPCFASDINTDLQSLLGTYANTNETLGASPYGPYSTTISSITQTSPTTADMMVTNIFDAGWDPVKFTIDWSDLNDIKVTLLQQTVGGDSGPVFGAAYNGIPMAVRPVPASAGGQIGALDFCGQKVTLRMQIGVSGVGFSGSLYTVTMAR